MPSSVETLQKEINVKPMQKKKFAKPKKNHYFCIAFQKA